MTHLKNWQTKFATTRPRRLLALDGGGIRGVMTLEILRKIEQDLATATGKGASFRLGDFFDYIGGTSTGAIIAAGLAMGKSVQELVDFYIEAGPLMFEKSSLIGRLRSFYQADPLRKKLNSVFGERTLGADDLCSLLLIVTRNATTDSPWPISNNPFAKYNDRDPSRTAICRFRCGSWCGRARLHPSISRPKYSRGIKTTRQKPSSSSMAASPPTITRPSSCSGWRRCRSTG